MDNQQFSRDQWLEAVRNQRLTLRALSHLTETSYRQVRAYAYGERRTPEAFIDRVWSVLAVLGGIRTESA